MLIRHAQSTDGHQISTFECGDPRRPWEMEVERAVRTSLSWVQGGTDDQPRELLVLEEAVTILGVAAVTYRIAQRDAYVNFVVIDRELHRKHLGRAFLTMVLEHMSDAGLDFAWWRVHPLNIGSLKLSLAVEAARDEDPEDGPATVKDPYVRFVVRL